MERTQDGGNDHLGKSFLMSSPSLSRVQPHMSYDIDGDGFVSQEDLKIGKTIDINSDGVIHDKEKQMGVVKMARVCLREVAHSRK